MKKKIILTKTFSKDIESYLKKGKLLSQDFDAFVKQLANNPEAGDMIAGTGGVRKIRLKSAAKGKRGGFRVCYYFFQIEDIIYLLTVYAKNEQENITSDEKNSLK